MERTTAPTVLDCVQALHWLHEASRSQPTTAPHLRDDSTGTQHLQWPKPGQQWILLKADVTKAHRRVKVLSQDWRFQVAELEGEWWINKVVGTYGMASAQLYWGRTAALILRLLYNLFPQVDWGFVFVDDFCWLLRAENADHQATAILACHSVCAWSTSELEEDPLGRGQHLAGLRYTPQYSTSPDDLNQTHPGLRSP